MKTVLFDFDMTLVDSAPAITYCMNRLAEEAGLRRCSEEEVRATIGLPFREALIELWGDYDPEWPEIYRSRLRGEEHPRLSLMEGARQLLAYCRDEGIATAIVTNRHHAGKAAGAIGLNDAVDLVIGLEEGVAAKPSPAMLELALHRLGGEKESACYVGDTAIDMRTAVAGGVPGIGVATGATGRDDLAEAGAAVVVDSLLELVPFPEPAPQTG
ncbi:MAG: HAD family hydrolase [Synergistales bacterium]|nr:HAD family hydrolase [Synergistales bacterium]